MALLGGHLFTGDYGGRVKVGNIWYEQFRLQTRGWEGHDYEVPRSQEPFDLISEMAVLRPVTGVRVEGERRVPRGRHRGIARERQGRGSIRTNLD